MTFDDTRKPATSATQEILRRAVGSLPFEDTSDFDRARRGLLAEPHARAIKGVFGHDVWNLDAYAFEAEGTPVPPSVHPSLWRQAQLNNIAGLFEVTDGVYQVRGMDISNITFIRGDRGWVVIDPLTGSDTARFACDMVNAHFGERPVTAVLYTHSHTDHFGGILGVVTEDDVAAGRVPIYAPEGFLEAAVSENIIAGTAMLRRATYMYGALIPKDELGHVDTGLGKTLPAAPGVALVAPTHDVTHDLKSVVLDGVEIHFQLTPGTEAPAEMNMWLPQFKALCLAENCTANFHNLYTLRGAQVRDALAWSKYTHQALREYGNRAEVAFASHHWPRWGSEISTYLEDQRDLYRYVHDQTMRLANHGATMKEIAEEVVLPEQLAHKFYLRDYYGTVRHNAKAVYQRYLGWFDANPATLNPHPPVVAAQKYVAFMGGTAAVMEKARESFDEGDYRWAAEVMNHVVFAEPENEQARFFQADILEQLGYQSESGPWRDFYLTGAQELRSNGTMLRGMKGNAMGTHMVSAMSMDQVCDLLGIRVNGPLLAKHSFTFNIDVSDRDEKWCVGIRHGALYAELGLSDTADFSLGGVFAGLTGFVTGNVELDKLLSEGLLTVTGSTDIFDRLCASLDSFSFGFDIVLP